MKKLLLLLTLFTSFLFASFIPAKACDFKNDVAVTSLSAGFDAWKVVTSAMEKC
jgi:hypothetical protein